MADDYGGPAYSQPPDFDAPGRNYLRDSDWMLLLSKEE
jgi:hypothetical protein